MQNFDFFKVTGYKAEGPVKTDLIADCKYKLATIGVESGVTIPPCVMDSEMFFFVVEGRGSISSGSETLSIRRGDVIVVPPRASRSIAAEERMSLLAVQIHAQEAEGEKDVRR